MSNSARLLLCRLPRHLRAVGLLAVMAAPSLQAETFTITTTDDRPLDGNLCQNDGAACTLRAAVQRANQDSGSHTINLPPGTYRLTEDGAGEDQAASGDLDIHQDLVIRASDGNGEAPVIQMDASIQDRLFHVPRANNPVRLTLKDLTLKGGHVVDDDGGALLNAGGRVSLDNCRIRDSTAEARDTPDSGRGGGLFNASRLTLKGTWIDSNQARHGGGVFNQGDLTIEDGSKIRFNRAEGVGGGIDNKGDPRRDNPATLRILDTIIADNQADEFGGGLHNAAASAVLQGVEIKTNSARTSGAGIDNASGSLLVRRSWIHHNTGAVRGGGMANFAGGDLIRSTVSHNEAQLGAGLYNGGDGQLTARNTTISANKAMQNEDGDGEGGGLFNSARATLTHVSLVDNTAVSAGPAIFTAANGSGGVTETELANTLIAATEEATVPACGGATTLLTAVGHNLETGDSCGLDPQAGDRVNVGEPGLNPTGLRSTDGQLAPVIALIDADGPAVDAAEPNHCPLNDQRNHERVEPCDIGAYELSEQRLDQALADLRLSLSDQLNPEAQGGGFQLVYTFTVRNLGPTHMPKAKLRVTLPRQVSLDALPEDHDCSGTQAGFSCTIEHLDAFAATQLTALVIPGSANITLHAQAQVTIAADKHRLDPFTANDTATVTTEVGTNEVGVDTGQGGGSDGGGGAWGLAALLTGPLLRRRARP